MTRNVNWLQIRAETSSFNTAWCEKLPKQHVGWLCLLILNEGVTVLPRAFAMLKLLIYNQSDSNNRWCIVFYAFSTSRFTSTAMEICALMNATNALITWRNSETNVTYQKNKEKWTFWKEVLLDWALLKTWASRIRSSHNNKDRSSLAGC